MKYITILEAETTEYQNVGTITTEDIGNRFKEAIESHFDATLISFSFVDEQISSLEDCISASPIDCVVKLDTAGGETDYTVELSETWLF